MKCPSTSINKTIQCKTICIYLDMQVKGNLETFIMYCSTYRWAKHTAVKTVLSCLEKKHVFKNQVSSQHNGRIFNLMQTYILSNAA